MNTVPINPRSRAFSALLLPLLATLPILSSQPAQPASPLDAWLASQQKVRTWSAGFIQTRTLTALNKPLTAQGQVWFAAPNRFRWELGHPPQTIAVRQTNQMLLIYPLLERVEKYSLDPRAQGPWHDALALLQAGFPRNRADLDSTFNLLSIISTNLPPPQAIPTTPPSAPQPVYLVTLQPKTAAARRMIPSIQITLAPTDYALRATELHFADGSMLRNQFTNAVLNPPLHDDLFNPKLEPHFKIVEPLKP